MNALSNNYWILKANNLVKINSHPTDRNPYFTTYWRDSGFEVVPPFCCCDGCCCCCCCKWCMLSWLEGCCCCINWNIWGLTESCGTMHLEGCSPLNSAVAIFNRWTSVVKASFKAVRLHHKQEKLHKQSI